MEPGSRITAAHPRLKPTSSLAKRTQSKALSHYRIENKKSNTPRQYKYILYTLRLTQDQTAIQLATQTAVLKDFSLLVTRTRKNLDPKVNV